VCVCVCVFRGVKKDFPEAAVRIGGTASTGASATRNATALAKAAKSGAEKEREERRAAPIARPGMEEWRKVIRLEKRKYGS
jgi:hypothetical protein